MTEAKPQYHAWFESLSDPSERYELDEIIYTDRNGGLLQVAHDQLLESVGQKQLGRAVDVLP